MRRITILALLYIGILLIRPLAPPDAGIGAAALLVFGFLILGANTIGESAAAVSLPKITGYLLTGVAFGPSVLGVVSRGVIQELDPVNQLAIALIAFLAGAELPWGELRARGRMILTILGTELTLAFTGIVGLLVVLRNHVPFLQNGTMAQVLALSALFGAVAIVHSPAVVIALISETKARGPVARSTLGIVMVADVVVVLAFSAALAITRSVVPAVAGLGAGAAGAAGSAGAGAAGGGVSAVGLAWELGGSVLVGAVLGGFTSLYLRFVKRELMMFAIVIAFFGATIANLLHVEVLLTLMVAGFVTENVGSDRESAAELRNSMERSAAPVFVVFFALAGAAIDLRVLAEIWPLAFAVVAVRGSAVWGGTTLGSRWGGGNSAERRYTWMGLIAQAGVAIGLVRVVSDAYPSRGAAIQTLLLAVIAIDEVIGQVLFRLALVRAGEVGGEAGDRGGDTGEVVVPAGVPEPS